MKEDNIDLRKPASVASRNVGAVAVEAAVAAVAGGVFAIER